MINKKINLIQIIEDEIKSNNSVFCKADFPVLNNNDFDYIFGYVNKHSNNIEVFKFITYCVKNIWKELSELEISRNLWDDDLSFLNLLFKRIYQVSDSYFILIENNKNQDALTVFRGYIELTSILFGCCLDKEFYLNYIKDIDNVEEYKRHWFKKLKPEQVKKTIKNINTQQRLYSSHYYDDTKNFFVGNQREIIYSYVSAICHGRFSQVKDNDLKQENELIIYSTDYLVNSMITIKQLTHNYCHYKNSIIERKHQIVMGIWVKILYENILSE